MFDSRSGSEGGLFNLANGGQGEIQGLSMLHRLYVGGGGKKEKS